MVTATTVQASAHFIADRPRWRGVNAAMTLFGLLVEKYERELFTTFEIIRDNVKPLITRGDFAKAQRIVFRARSSINSFFDNVLVMSEDTKLRRNRLALLQAVSRLLGQIADYSQIVVQG